MRTIKIDYVKLIILLAILVTLIFGLYGCGDAGVTNTSVNTTTGDKNISISVKTDNTILDNPSDVLVIEEAKVLIKEVEFELEGSEIEHEVNAGPFVINFNLAGGVTPVTIGNVPAGTYNKIKFQVHKPEDSETIPDPEFREGSSGNLRYSFIIKGKFNGNSFVYKSRKSVNLVINFSTPVNVQTASRNITILINPDIWFKSGSLLLDPRNSSHENEIDDNLKNSFKRAFKDDDKNGRPDDN